MACDRATEQAAQKPSLVAGLPVLLFELGGLRGGTPELQDVPDALRHAVDHRKDAWRDPRSPVQRGNGFLQPCDEGVELGELREQRRPAIVADPTAVLRLRARRRAEARAAGGRTMRRRFIRKIKIYPFLK